jgi:lactoylglutathione lyase
VLYNALTRRLATIAELGIKGYCGNTSAIRRDHMRVKYATIIVRDMEESVKFYTKVMGFEVDSQHKPVPGVVITLMKSNGDAMVELIKNPKDEIGLYSVGMQVKDLNTTIKELKSKGAKITVEPVPITVGSLAFCEDPNGVKIALIQHH